MSRPLFVRRHYEALALVFGHRYRSISREQVGTPMRNIRRASLDVLVNKLGDLFTDDSQAFDRALWKRSILIAERIDE